MHNMYTLLFMHLTTIKVSAKSDPYFMRKHNIKFDFSSTTVPLK